MLQKFDFDKQISNNIPAFEFSYITYLVSNMSSFKNFSTELIFFFNQTASNNSHAVLGITLGKVINVLFFLRNPGFPSSTTDLTTCNYNVQKAIEGTFFKYFLSSFSPNYSAIFVDFLKKLHTR